MDWFTKLDAPSVFIASPGELASLRESIRQEVEALAGRLADGVKPYAWEFEKSKTGFDHWRPLTTQIPLPASRYCRALICVFGERIGTPISRSRDFPLEVVGDWGRGEAPEPHLVYPWREGAELEGGFALTGTVFEYFVAMAANERRGLPRKGAPPVLLMFVGDAGGLERGGRLEAGVVGPRPTGGAEARERRSQLRQLQNFLRYVRSRGRDCSFVDSEQQALQKTHAFLEGVLGLDETRDGFKGLQFYDVDDELVFFGRAALIDYALDKFGQLWTRDGLAPFFGLFGGSGAGKSSLLRAGLLSRLLRQTWRGYFDCAVVTANEIASGLDDGGAPSHDSASPLGVVCAKALSAVSDADGLAEAGATPRRAAHEGGPEAAVARLVEALDAGRRGGRRRLVIGLDQFEQLIDYRAEPEKRERLEPLFRFFEAAVASRRIGFIYTCQPNRRQLIEQDAVLRSLVSRGDEVEVLFPAESVEEIVRGLFERAKVPVRPEYVKVICGRILDFVEQAPSQLKTSLSSQASLLPLVSLALSRIHDKAAKLNEGGAASTVPEAAPSAGPPARGAAAGPDAALDAEQAKLVDIKGAIAELAEKALTEARHVPGVEWTDESVGVLLRRLVRIQAGEEERFHLPESSLPARGVVRVLSQSLTRYRLLLPTTAGRVRLAHEAVVYYWPLAEQWFAQERALLGTAAILSARARRWDGEGRSVEALKGLGHEVDEAAELLRCWPDVYSPVASVQPREEDQLLCDYAFAAFEALMQPGRVAKGRADESTHFLTAVTYGRDGLVKKYLAEEPAAIEHRTSEDANAAYCAAFNDSVETMETVLAAGAAPDVPNKEGWLPVHVAANWGRVEALDRLVAAGARPDAEGSVGMTATHLAARNGDARTLSHLLSRYDLDPDAATTEGHTPLHLACHYDEQGAAALLVASGKVNPSRQANDGWSAFHLACRYCGREAVALLLAHPLTDVRAPTQSGWPPLHLAVAGKRTEVVAELVADERVDGDARSPEGWTALHTALHFEVPHLLDLLLSRRTAGDPNPPDDKGETPLHLAAAKGYEEATELLLRSGADPNAAGDFLWSPLHAAAHRGHAGVARVLLAHRATKVDVPDAHSRTPLHVALEAHNMSVAQLLLDRGARLDARRGDGLTALHYAAHPWHELAVEFLLTKGADANAPDGAGRTPLHLAAENGSAAIARLLLDHGAQHDARDSDGWTPLHVAAQNGHDEVVRLLLARGAEREAVSGSPPLTPLQAAAEAGHTGVVSLLLAEGADPHARNGAKSTPFVLAIKNLQYQAALQLLESAGEAMTDDVLAEAEAALADIADGADAQFVGEFGYLLESIYRGVRRRRGADASANARLLARMEAAAGEPWHVRPVLDAPPQPVPPVLDGEWREATADEAVSLLAAVWPKLPFGCNKTLDDFDGLRRMKLPFYQETELCEARCGREGVLVFLRRGEECVTLWGNGGTLREWNVACGLRLETPEMALAYLRFFCAVISGEEGAFVPFERGDRLLPTAHMPAEVAQRARALARPARLLSETPDEYGRWRAEAVVKYGPAIFEGEFDIQPDGQVVMLRDDQLARGLHVLAETFKNGLRVLRAVKVEEETDFLEPPGATGE